MLQFEGFDVLNTGTDKTDAIGIAEPGKFQVLAEESIPWVHGRCAGSESRRDNFLGQEVAFTGRTCTEQDCLMSLQDMARFAIRLRIDSYRTNAHSLQSVLDSAGNRATIRN
jgi:hypothetical protein